MTDREERLRLFVAVELPEGWLRALATVQDDLRRALAARAGVRGAPRLRWTRPEGVHLTLKFLGEVPAARREAIEAALARAVDAPPGLELRLGNTGAFGINDRRGPRVLWVGVSGDVEGLGRLFGQIDASLGTIGFERERRSFAAHLTLARVPDDFPAGDRAALADALVALPLPDAPSFVVERVSLMRSHLNRDGARYERLASFPGAGPAPKRAK